MVLQAIRTVGGLLKSSDGFIQVTCWFLMEGSYYTYELSICLSNGQTRRGVWFPGSGGDKGLESEVQGPRGLGSEERGSRVQHVKIWGPEGLKDAVPLLNFQIQLLGEEIWGKNCIFEDKIKLWVFKLFVFKNKLTLVWNFFISDYKIEPLWSLNYFQI